MLVVKDDDEFFDNMFAFMAQSDEVTLLDLKENLDLYSIKKFKKLACVLVDSICESTAEKDLLNSSLDVSQDENISLTN